jgi:hypothetical protein
MILAAMILGGVILLVDPQRVWARTAVQRDDKDRIWDHSAALALLRCLGVWLLFVSQHLLWQMLNS